MRKGLLVLITILAGNLSLASELTVVRRDGSTPHAGKIVKATFGNFLPDTGNLVINVESGETCVIDQNLAMKNGYTLVALGGLIAQDLVDITCELKNGKIIANAARIFFKIK